ncbi:periplasmic binding protein-like I [Cladochytrium replicatum]|nr:periplasmic binding protein-like I [Cladochytrium replicatum]
MQKWKQLAVIQDDSDYGLTSAMWFRAIAASRNLTIGTSEVIPRNFSDLSSATDILARIKARHFNIIALFVSLADANRIALAANNLGMVGAPYVWLGTMAWALLQTLRVGATSNAAKANDPAVVAALSGMISTYWTPPANTQVATRYKNYILANQDPPTSSTVTGRSFKDASLNRGLTYAQITQFADGLQAYDAVITLAYGLAKAKISGQQRNGTAVLTHMLAQKFDGVSGKIAYDPSTGERDVSIGVDLWNLLPNGTFVTFGQWDPKSGIKQNFPPIFSTGSTIPPNDGQCANGCHQGDCDYDQLICRCWPGYSGADCSITSPLTVNDSMKQNYLIKCGSDPFIYTFTPPAQGKVIRIVVTAPATLQGGRTILATLLSSATGKNVSMDNGTTSMNDQNPYSDDPVITVPGSTRFTIQVPYSSDSSASATTPNYPLLKPYILRIFTASSRCDTAEFNLAISFDSMLVWTNPLALGQYVLFGIATCAVLVLGFLGYVLFTHQNRKIFKQSGIDAVSTIVFGVASGFVGPLVGPWVSTRPGCQVYNWSYHIAFWLVYGTLLSKNLRVYFIFNNSRGTILPWYHRNLHWKTAVIMFILACYLSAWTIIQYPSATNVTVDGDRIFATCKTSAWDFIIAALEFVFLLGCAVLAYKTRKIPDDFNESQLVANSTYNAFLLKIFNILLQSMSSAQRNNVIQLIGSNIEIFLSYFVTVLVIFVPKIKSVYVEKNPKDHSSNSRSNSPPRSRSASLPNSPNREKTGLMKENALAQDRVGDAKNSNDTLGQKNTSGSTGVIAQVYTENHDPMPCERVRAQDTPPLGLTNGRIVAPGGCY